MKNNKPIWNKKQVSQIKRYLKSKKCAHDLNKMQQEWEEREERERQEFMEWWIKNKDIPYM